MYSLCLCAYAQDEDTTVPALMQEEETTAPAELPARLLEAYAAAGVTSEQLHMLYPLDLEIQRAGPVKEDEQMADWAEARRSILMEEQLRVVRRELRRGLGVAGSAVTAMDTTATAALDVSTTGTE